MSSNQRMKEVESRTHKYPHYPQDTGRIEIDHLIGYERPSRRHGNCLMACALNLFIMSYKAVTVIQLYAN